MLGFMCSVYNMNSLWLCCSGRGGAEGTRGVSGIRRAPMMYTSVAHEVSAKYHKIIRSPNDLIYQNYMLLYLFKYTQKSYVLINHELTQEIHIIVVNAAFF